MPGADEQDFYKREEDKRWRERVEERLASLTSGENVQDDRLDALNEKLNELHELLEGVAGDKNDNGIKGDVKEIWTNINRINSALSLDLTGRPGYDGTGNPGALKKVDIMWEGGERSERRADRIWKGMTPIVVAIVTLAGTVFLNFDKITTLIHGKQVVTRQSKQVKKPKRRPRPEQRIEATDNDVPEVRDDHGVP